MRFNCPFVSRRRYNVLERRHRQTRLELEVAQSSVQHLTDRRLEHVAKLANAAVKIDKLEKELKEFTLKVEAKSSRKSS